MKTTNLYGSYKAISTRSFAVEKPMINILNAGFNPSSGLVYCAKSASKSGQLKIGVTTIKLKTRLRKIAPRYGIEEVRPLFTISVDYPAEIEHHAQVKLRGCRVTGKTKNDSVEWYRTTAIEFVRAVVATVEERGNSVLEVTLFADCPNAGKVKAELNRLGVNVRKECY